MFNRSIEAGRVYSHLIRKSIYNVIIDIGEARMLNEIINSVNQNIFYDIDTISALKRKRERNRNRVSLPELATAATIVSNNMIGCWEQIRIFPERYDNRKSIKPDFFTNMMINDKLLAIEFHSLKMHFRIYSRQLHKIKEDLEKRIAAHKNKGPFFIFTSDVDAEFLSNFGYNVMDFCDCYLNISNNRAIYDNDEYSLTYDSKADAKLINDFSKQYYRLFLRDFEGIKDMARYSLGLSNLLNIVLPEENTIKKLYYSEFVEHLYSYVRRQIKEDILGVVEFNVKK